LGEWLRGGDPPRAVLGVRLKLLRAFDDATENSSENGRWEEGPTMGGGRGDGVSGAERGAGRSGESPALPVTGRGGVVGWWSVECERQ